MIKPRLFVTFSLLLLTGCHAQTAPPAPTQPRDGSIRAASLEEPVFDGSRAYGFLQSQCRFGVRPPGSAAHEQCRSYLLKQLAPYADKVITQQWTYHDTDRHATLPLTNILAIIHPQGKRKIMLFTHWDTRPTADQELDASNKKKPIMGADDGASGTAVLLELARVFHQRKPNVCVELLFVDGEDWGPGEEKMYLGASYFASNPGTYKPEYAILLDMVGDKDLNIYRERTSQQIASDLNDKVWDAAASLGYSQQFPNAVKWEISDDHITFNRHGIRAIDLIDFDYANWHTLGDTPDKCSPQSLKAVGDVMEKVVYTE